MRLSNGVASLNCQSVPPSEPELLRTMRSVPKLTMGSAPTLVAWTSVYCTFVQRSIPPPSSGSSPPTFTHCTTTARPSMASRPRLPPVLLLMLTRGPDHGRPPHGGGGADAAASMDRRRGILVARHARQ
eukprot:SAG22_NODE_386_length_11304_cov_3.084694_3_plen_129_part_00